MLSASMGLISFGYMVRLTLASNMLTEKSKIAVSPLQPADSVRDRIFRREHKSSFAHPLFFIYIKRLNITIVNVSRIFFIDMKI